MMVWLSEAHMRSRNYMESLDDYTYASWRGHNSFDDARNSGTRASSYPRVRKPNDNQTVRHVGGTAFCAPIGHRQPRTADVPASTSGSRQILDQEDARVDRSIRSVCRGC